jgi:uncharacterized SAM-binding protein YcdF (DUF218 family)
MGTFKGNKVLIPLFILAAVCVIGWIAFRHFALWLVVSDPLPPSLDVIFTFAGETHRIIYSKELYCRYPNAQWVLSYPTKKITVPLSRDGFDTSRIIIVDTCKNTNSEALFIIDWAAGKIRDTARYSKKQPMRIGLVSTPFHMRRIRMEISRKNKGGTCIFYYLPVPYERYGLTRNDYGTWWKVHQLRNAIVLELKKNIYYFWIK